MILLIHLNIKIHYFPYIIVIVPELNTKPKMVAKIWKFFAKININGEFKRKCLKCGEMLPTPKDFSTSNMINHLKSKGHEKELEQYNKDENTEVKL